MGAGEQQWLEFGGQAARRNVERRGSAQQCGGKVLQLLVVSGWWWQQVQRREQRWLQRGLPRWWRSPLLTVTEQRTVPGSALCREEPFQ